jgi:transposase-like protein
LFDVEKIEERLKNVKSLADLTGKDGVLKEMLKATVERLLKAELDAHLGTVSVAVAVWEAVDGSDPRDRREVIVKRCLAFSPP